jgi:hypothetical protein
MNFGEAWKSFLGECNKEQSFEILDFFYDQGGNFIDTYVVARVILPLLLLKMGLVPTTIRMRRAKPGLESGWRREVSEIRWLLQPSTQQASGPMSARRFCQTVREIASSLCMYQSTEV